MKPCQFFGRFLQSHLLNVIQAEVEKALAGAYSAAAGKKMERWVHSKITDLTHHIRQVTHAA